MDREHDNSRDQDLSKYLKDIETIKDLLFEAEKKPLYEHWAFYAWGGLIILGSLIHFFTERHFNLTVTELFLKVWLPVILVAGFLELISFIRNMSKHSLSLFSRSISKIYLSLIGSCVAFCFIVIFFINLDAVQYLPVVFLFACAVLYFIFAQMSAYTHLFIHGFLMILLAVILYLFNIDHYSLSLIIGLVIGFSLITAGFTSGIIEKKTK